jgi:KaiC/GvpD/RAD55 family RecA-like ATPase
MSEENVGRVPTGVSGLDELISGGFPRRSLIILAGNPGTGKTVFSAQFLYRGCVDYGECGVYASLAESREQFIWEMRDLGFNFEKLEEEGRFRFHESLTAKEAAAPAVLESILEEIGKIGAKRLVIDSFSALAQAFREPHEARIILHTILSRVVRYMGCTTILIVEVPHGEEKIGLGVEEFVADGIIVLRRKRFDGRILRDLEILKMRGTPTPEVQVVFTLKDGFKAFPPFKPKPVEEPSRFKPQPDKKEYFSTGSQDMDKMLGGGYPRGSTVLIEIGGQISTLQYHLISVPTAWNFILNGRGVTVIPTRGVDHNLLRVKAEEGGLTCDEVNRLLRICVREYLGIKPEPYIVAFKGEDAAEDYAKYLDVEQKLIESTGQPTLHVAGVDTLIDNYRVEGALSIIRIQATRIRERGGLGILLLKPSHQELAKTLAALTDVHLKITREHGAVLVYGVKPRTSLHVLEMDTSEGYPMPKITPII